MESLKQRVDFVLKSHSFRSLMRRYYDMPVDSDTIGWTLTLFKKFEMPDMEIYVDEVARAVAFSLREKGFIDADENVQEEMFKEVMVDAFSEVLVHELCHYMGIHSEKAVDEAVKAIFDSDTMGWHLIACPKHHEPVSWPTCLKCTDFEKHESCPLQKVRQASIPRLYTPKLYHVTELQKIRYAFYERWNKTISSWDDWWSMFWGTAMGHYIESLYPEGYQEFEFNVSAADLAKFYKVEPSEIDDFVVTGHADIVDKDIGLVIELKTSWSLKYVKDGPNPNHRWQIQAYYTLGLIEFPEIFEKLKAIKIVYYGRQWRGATLPPTVEHTVPMQTVDLLTPARMMRESEESGIPPSLRCPEWLCRYCKSKDLCNQNVGREEDD